ncbi:MAG: TIGR03790 family protein [Desulfopila sp.]
MSNISWHRQLRPWFGGALKPALSALSVVSAMALLVFSTTTSWAIAPEELLVVANKRMAGSVDLARLYIERRAIPRDNLLILSLPRAETISRSTYVDSIRLPVRRKIDGLRNNRGQRIEAILLIYGVPLKIMPPQPDDEDREQIDSLRRRKNALAHSKDADEAALKQQRRDLDGQLSALLKTNQHAAVDSELSLVRAEDYDLEGWIPNPYFPGFRNMEKKYGRDQVMLVSRLDGPDVATVQRMIDDTLETEEEGLSGTGYIDARWPEPESKQETSAYRIYDASLYGAARYIEKRMKVVVEKTGELFAGDCCDRAALYCGWYSLGQYQDTFQWSKGAIGYHMASSECSTLKNKESNVWCLKILENGAAATIGPVYEPYIQGFPIPEIFFAALLEGYMSLGEAYLLSLPYVSWQMVLVGDPLYRPFRPLEKEEAQ